MAIPLGCNSTVVDTMSWRGMVTHQKNSIWYVETYYRNTRHRLDGPAVESVDGDKFWYVNNRMHRVDGPAKEYANGEKEWWIAGVRQK